MDFELDDDQRQILEAVGALLERHAGPARASELAQKSEYDFALDTALAEAGFDEIVEPSTGEGALSGVLVVEAIGRAAGLSSYGFQAVVAPAVVGARLPGPVALAEAPSDQPIRFGAHARSLLWVDGDTARWCALEPGEVVSVRSGFGYPFGRVDPSVAARGETLGEGSGDRLRSWWRLAVAAEAVGSMAAALDQTVAYLKLRRQFGRPIASFQAVQHRLAECAIGVEGSRWLVYEAAHQRAPDEATACAAAYALDTARLVFRETHQLSGAIGFTYQHDLHAWSMRLHALAAELGGVASHRRALADARWGLR